MRYKFGKTIVVALGGSIIHPDAIGLSYIKKFKKFIGQKSRKGTRFVIVIGGGRLARIFQYSAKEITALTDEDRDWLGIHATRLNAHLIRTIFRKIADPVIIDSRGKIPKLKFPVTIAAGWRPGWSTDFVAAALAADFGVKDYIVAGKPDHVYDRDPHAKGGKKAKSFDEISWRNYRKLIPTVWKPGAHAPVDPVAARFSQKEKLAAIIIDGRNLKNFANLLNNRDFEGTIIR